MSITHRVAARDYRRMPWKNGGGETIEIARFPEEADLGTFDWRISMATVAADGPFSTFPGIDRTLAVLTGSGLFLQIGASEEALLRVESEPLAFPADVATSARLVAGPITDLNLMTRRATHRHTLTLQPVPSRQPGLAGGIVYLIVKGEGHATGTGFSATLADTDALRLTAETDAVEITGVERLYRLEIRSL